MKTTNKQTKSLILAAVMTAVTGSVFAAGVNNTVDPNAALYGAEAYGKSNVIEAGGTSAFAVGYNNTVSKDNAFVYGNTNKASGTNSIAGGEYSKAVGRNSVAIGSNAEALKDNTFAIGSQARTAANNTVAIGNGAYASNTNALAIGVSTVADGKDSIAFGSHVQSHSDHAVAIGTAVTTNSNDSIGIGHGVTNSLNNSIGIGNGVVNNLNNSIGIGNGVVTNFNTVGIGNGVATNVQDGIGVGNGVTINGESSVAIGNGISAGGVKTVNIGTNVNATGVSSIVVGRDTTVNGDDTTVVGANNGTVAAGQSVVVGYNNKVLGTDPEHIIVGSNSKTEGQGSIAVGTHAEATATDAMAIGNNTVSDQANAVALGTNSTTDAVVSTDHIYINGKKYDFAGGTANSTISVGATNKAGAGGVTDYKRTITNVAAGRIDSDSTDAVNGSQLNAVINSLNFTTVADGKNTTVAETTNIDGGKEFSVSVNKDLYDMNSANFGATAEPVRSVVNKEKVHFFNDNTSTNTKVSATGLAIENTDNLDSATHDINGVTVDSNNRHIAFTTNGIDAGNQVISNVADGVKDTDAVNFKQLKDSISTESVITDNQVDNIAAVRVTNGKSTGDANAQYGVYVSRTTVDAIAKGSNRFAGDDVIKVERWVAPSNVADLTTFKYDGNKAAAKTPLTYKANGKTETTMLSNGLDFTNGSNTTASVDANGVVKYDLNKDISVDSVTTGKLVADKANIGGVVIDNSGINAGGKTITNVARGINANDAVTVGQLNDVRTAMSNGDAATLNRANAYTDSRVSETTAQNAALAALHPLDFNKHDKFQIATGVGNYKNKTAVALGAFYQPNENTLLSLGATLGAHRNVVNAGATFRFGKHSEMNTDRHDALENKVKTLEETLVNISAKYDELLKKVEETK